METVLGIFRAACFSPGMVGRDEAILCAVAERLEAAGYVVSLMHEEDFSSDIPMPDIVLHMVRSPQALEILAHWQDAGCRVLNCVEGVRGVEREALALRCAELGIPTPMTWIVDTADIHFGEVTFPCWVKRTGTCAQEPDDVCFAPDAEAYCDCITRFHARGIYKVVVMEHLEGTVIKFYGVQGTDFFYAIPAEKLGYNKWGEVGDDRSLPQTPFRSEESFPLSDIFIQLGKGRREFPTIYGGDAIIGADGIARLIDLNDWPSFSVCREAAADAIVGLVISKKSRSRAVSTLVRL